MSQWTHINAAIRFDVVRALGMTLPDLGNTCTYESNEEEWENCNVPKGSEGSMQYQSWENPNDSSMAGYTVMFWGDLRDYSDSNAILHYFNKIIKGQMIRSGLLEIDVEFRETQVYRCKENEWVLMSNDVLQTNKA